jgi:hypothetical protein
MSKALLFAQTAFPGLPMSLPISKFGFVLNNWIPGCVHGWLKTREQLPEIPVQMKFQSGPTTPAP